MSAIGSSLERAFDARWSQFTRDLEPAPPEPTSEVHFHLERAYRFDRAWVSRLVYLEIHGGGHVGGYHNREAGMVEDFTKYNLAVSMGWRGVYATSTMIMDDPEPVIQTILTLLSHPVLSPDAEHTMWVARIRNLTKVDDAVSNNGITVKRMKTNKFLVQTGKSEYLLGGRMPLIDAQRQVLDFILRGKNAAATPAGLVRMSYASVKACF